MAGFSLFEILISITIILTVSYFGLSSLEQFLFITQQEVSLQEFLSLITKAKHLSELQHQAIGISIEKNQLRLFYDVFQNGKILAPSQLIITQQLPTHSSLTWKTFPRYRTYILFTPEEIDNGSIQYCLSAHPAWQVILDKRGNVKTATESLHFGC